MDHNALVAYSELRSRFGITYCRTQIKRLEDAGKFPKRFKPFPTRGSHFFYRLADILAWLKGEWRPA
jgi:hypothetical protein